jgi:hypothetical protein
MSKLKRELSFRDWISNDDESFRDEETQEASSVIAYFVLMWSVYLKELFLA